MYKFLSRPHHRNPILRPLSGAALLLFTVLSVVAPAQIQHSDARTFSSGLKIKLERNTPPFAALEDNFIDHIDASPGQAVVKTEALTSSPNGAGLIVSRIVKGEESPAKQTIALRSVSRDDLLQTLFLPLVQSMQNSASDDDAPIAAPQLPAVLNHAALARTPAAVANRTVVRPTSPSPGDYSPPVRPAAQPVLNHQTVSAEAFIEPLSRQISGTLELTNGLALTSPSDQITVYHELEDAPSGVEGTVWIRDGRYKIQVDNLSGRLVAELRNARGDLLGRGQLDLVDLPLQKSQQFKVTDVELKIAPVAQGLAGQIISGNAYPGQSVVVGRAQVSTNAQTELVVADARGSFQDDAIDRGSTALTKVSRAGYWKTVAIGAADQLNTLTLLPKALLKSVAQIAKLMHPLSQIDHTTAIVWGHVFSNGKPVDGAQVQLLTAGEELAPIYFNEMMIPDPNLTATSSNGLFSFVGVPRGAQVVQATLAGHLSEPVAFPAEPQELSVIDIDMVLSRRMTLKSFDAFSPTLPLPSVGAKLGSNRKISIDKSGSGFLRFAAGSSLMVMDFDAQAPYLPERFMMSREKTHAYLPMVKADWVDGLRGGTALTPGTGTVVGFVQGTSTYHTVVDQNLVVAQAAGPHVVYFDAHGERTQSGFGEPGGGFVIFNLPEGYRQIAVTADNSDRISTSVVLADSHVVSVVNHSTH